MFCPSAQILKMHYFLAKRSHTTVGEVYMTEGLLTRPIIVLHHATNGYGIFQTLSIFITLIIRLLFHLLNLQ